MNIGALYQIYQQHPVISTDSRNCPPGSLFFALKGESFNGNHFADKALAAGCSYAVVDDPSIRSDDRHILVDDVLQTLQQLAAHHRRTLHTPVIAITGTNGKTTTKELVAAVLATKYHLLYTSGNLNNHIGVPLTLLRLRPEHEIAAIEMGANHPGEISALCRIAQPDYGIITNVGLAHLEGFGSFEGVIQTKGELYDYLRETKGKIFIHRDNPHLKSIAAGLEQIAYGESPAPTDASRIQTQPTNLSPNERFTAGKIQTQPSQPENNKPFVSGRVQCAHPLLSIEWENAEAHYSVSTQLVGTYNLWNVLAAISVGLYFNVPAQDINRAISEYQPSNNRSQRQKTAHNELIIDAYNANPSSMEAALSNFASLPVTPKAVILGDMLELGAECLRLHAEIVKQLDRYAFEKVFLCGNNFSSICSEYQCFPDIKALSRHLSSHQLRGHFILIKGSHGIHLEKIIDFL
ncbi:MAG: UDP-N-acetylmuramoyl-tripeptide--D-alanyl-D-alanine ligase [Tannerella sp.]|jgi:UDP-N-acetylmuramoyl-tripeptide--D-alanyl-D-alanine ligase|nr:UDP-N-acetylmuramoyl-tripeptide--D-alanyl-D-alanine ligase [Tannerella sp.]